MKMKMEIMPKQKVTVTIEKRLLEWVDREVKSFRFRNRSHALEYALAKLIGAGAEKEA